MSGPTVEARTGERLQVPCAAGGIVKWMTPICAIFDSWITRRCSGLRSRDPWGAVTKIGATRPRSLPAWLASSISRLCKTPSIKGPSVICMPAHMWVTAFGRLPNVDDHTLAATNSFGRVRFRSRYPRYASKIARPMTNIALISTERGRPLRYSVPEATHGLSCKRSLCIHCSGSTSGNSSNAAADTPVVRTPTATTSSSSSSCERDLAGSSDSLSRRKNHPGTRAIRASAANSPEGIKA